MLRCLTRTIRSQGDFHGVATTAEVYAEFAAALGLNHQAVERYALDLRKQPDLGPIFPKSGRGGGRQNAHVYAPHLANLVLAFASPVPGGALDAQQRLRPLRCQPDRMKTPHLVENRLLAMAGLKPTPRAEPVPKEIRAQTLGERLEHIITEAAFAVLSPGGDALLETMRAQNWYFSLSPSDRMAWISWSEDGASLMDTYSEPQDRLMLADYLRAPPVSVRRSASFDFDLIELSARLLADTLDRDLKKASAPLLAEAQKQTPGQQGRASDTDQQKQQAPAGNTDTPDPTARERDEQALRARRLFGTAGQPSTPNRKGTAPDGPYSADASAA